MDYAMTITEDYSGLFGRRYDSKAFMLFLPWTIPMNMKEVLMARGSLYSATLKSTYTVRKNRYVGLQYG